MKLVLCFGHRWRLSLLLCTALLTVFLLSRYQSLPPPLLTSLAVDLSTGQQSIPTNTTSVRTTNYKKRFPQAIIIGVRKAGTRALLDMLTLHPSVVSPKPEIHYFDKEENYVRRVQWYIDSMPRSYPQQITIEKTPAYFVGPQVPQRIHSVSPNVKLLLIVRNPIDRTVSDFAQLNNKRRKTESHKHTTFEKAVFNGDHVNTLYNPISVSLYDVHFKSWLDYFPLSQILVVDGDSLITNPLTQLKRAEAFLGIESYFTESMFFFNETKGFYCWRKISKDAHCLGSGKGREHPEVSPEAVQALKQFFKPHNQQFYNQCGQPFNW